METGGRLEFGVCAAVDVHYLSTGGARAAAVLAADAAFAHVLAERTTVLPRVPPYRPGEFYLRELPPLRAVLEDLSGLGLLVVDGYADLDPSGRPGLGARAHAEFGLPVIGVAKSRFRTATHAVPVLRGSSVRAAWFMAHRSQAEPCLAMCPCRTVRSEPRTVGVSPAQLASLRALPTRLMSPISASITRAVNSPAPGSVLSTLTRGSALARACSSPSIRSITGARPSMTARQSVMISRDEGGRPSSASQPRPGPVQ